VSSGSVDMLTSGATTTHGAAVVRVVCYIDSVHRLNYCGVPMARTIHLARQHNINLTTVKNNTMRLPNSLCYVPFLPRGLSRHAVSVCVCARLSRSWILSKRINISSTFFHFRIAKPLQFVRTKRHGNIST